ncbi:MAG TPA: GNAT family N-acetyltransferase [Acidimicrobiales bacterium]|nr:GNAT family N-acetyltransferase [Acidimicrobiales bacterium]
MPTWFGIESANEDYIAKAEWSPTIVAAADGHDVGLTVIERHFPTAAEVHLIAVTPEHHRAGIGRAMLRFAEAQLADEGVRFLQVKTLSPARVDAGYENTRAFYLAYGFEPLEEFPELWDPSNPALQMIKVVQPDR